ncbi:MAG: hypothetical protein ACOYN0_16630, partial [Phycisphaerales bacterium]
MELFRLIRVALLLLCSLAPAASAGPGAVAPVDLRAEFRVNPAGIGVTTPRLSWTLEPTDPGAKAVGQSGYRLVASTTQDALERGEYTWDSGVVRSAAHSNIAYAGPALASRATIYWRV